MREYEFFKLNVNDGIATISLDRPPLNVLHTPMLVQLNEALQEVLADDDLVAVMFRSPGKAFCAGVDVSELWS